MTAQETTAQHTPDPGHDVHSDPVGRTVRSVRHGGQVRPHPRPRPQPDPDPGSSPAPLLHETELAVLRDLVEDRFEATTSFDYLFRDLRGRFPDGHLPVTGGGAPPDGPIANPTVTAVVASLKKLGAAMIEPAGPPNPALDSTVPAAYTYWGQFIDHDITLHTNGPDGPPEPGERPRPGDLALGDIVADPFTAFPPEVVVRSLHNGRHPYLNLDSLYGSGPRFPGEPGRRTTRSEAAYATNDPAKLALGRVATSAVPGFELVAPGDDPQRDLPRFSAAEVAALPVPAADRPAPGSAKIPDGRNDENLVVAQLHLAFVRFHNAVVDWVRRTEPWLTVDDRAVFDRAQRLTQHHYQWLVVHDYLRTLTKPGVLDEVLVEPSLLFRPRRTVAMPLEFAVAAFRFGHSMVRGGYDFNLNFGKVVPPAAPPRSAFASLVQLFEFTGGGGLVPTGAPRGEVLPSNWPIDWSRFVDKGDPDRRRSAAKIDPFLAAGLATMRNEGNDPGLGAGVGALLKQLAQRNLLRGYWLSLPTGEAVARALHVPALTPEQLSRGAAQDVEDALAELDGTPLWYYVLKEAEVQGNGNFLGDVGSRILCETFVYLLKADGDSFLSAGWTPAQGVRIDGGKMITTLPDLLRFAGVLALDGGTTFRQVDGRPAGHDGD
ncbi:heme peroxidase family protein [Isoptericola sp. NPDC057559]|uniref:peroxidase family protein n=1 Tax=Isoptericola sp. NPDC057559 TaxID=3346168 RepID=UPI0036A55B83